MFIAKIKKILAGEFAIIPMFLFTFIVSFGVAALLGNLDRTPTIGIFVSWILCFALSSAGSISNINKNTDKRNV